MFPDAITYHLPDLPQGADWGVVFSDPNAAWSGSAAAIVLTQPGGTVVELSGTVSLDGTSAAFSRPGSVTQGWPFGPYSYAFWVTVGGSRVMPVGGTFRVYLSPGGLP